MSEKKPRHAPVRLMVTPPEDTTPEEASRSFVMATEILAQIAERLRERGMWPPELPETK